MNFKNKTKYKNKKNAVALMLVVIFVFSVAMMTIATVKIISTKTKSFTNSSDTDSSATLSGRYLCYLDNGVKKHVLVRYQNGVASTPSVGNGCNLSDIPKSNEYTITAIGGGSAGTKADFKTTDLYNDVYTYTINPFGEAGINTSGTYKFNDTNLMTQLNKKYSGDEITENKNKIIKNYVSYVQENPLLINLYVECSENKYLNCPFKFENLPNNVVPTGLVYDIYKGNDFVGDEKMVKDQYPAFIRLYYQISDNDAYNCLSNTTKCLYMYYYKKSNNQQYAMCKYNQGLSRETVCSSGKKDSYKITGRPVDYVFRELSLKYKKGLAGNVGEINTCKTNTLQDLNVQIGTGGSSIANATDTVVTYMTGQCFASGAYNPESEFSEISNDEYNAKIGNNGFFYSPGSSGQFVKYSFDDFKLSNYKTVASASTISSSYTVNADGKSSTLFGASGAGGSLVIKDTKENLVRYMKNNFYIYRSGTGTGSAASVLGNSYTTSTFVVSNPTNGANGAVVIEW